MKKQIELDRDDVPADVSKLGGWTRARKTADATRVRLPTRRITINLDADIVAIFKAEAFRGGLPYQVAINQALRRFLAEREETLGERAAATVLAALEHPSVVKRIRAVASRRPGARSSR
jgi:uncharacterized protein (DUF4415 family)